jgi:hypothetical protein
MTMGERIYRVLLKAYPSAFLREYGGPMEQLFRDQLKDAVVRKRVTQFWARIIVDLVKTAPFYHWMETSTATGGTMRLRETGAVTFAAIIVRIGIRLAFYGKRSWFAPFANPRFSVIENLTYEIALFTVITAVILVPALSMFLIVTKRLGLTGLLRGLLVALPILAIGRIGWTLMWLYTPEPPYHPNLVVRNLCLQWLPVFLSLGLSIWMGRHPPAASEELGGDRRVA